MRRALLALLALAAAAAIAFYFLTIPVTVPASALPNHTPDAENGKYMFTAGGCADCHAAPAGSCDDLDIEDEEVLAGGRCLKTPFGTFHVPNISPDKKTGIGTWSTLDFVTAMKRGVAPGDVHLYPAFPYTSYQRMTYEDLIDLKAYLDTLPAVSNQTPPHELGFPYNIRRGLGLYQRLYVDGEDFSPDPDASDEINRGAYLARGAGHCSECHSPRNVLGGIMSSKEFAGARNPEGDGTVPNITPSDDGISEWSEEDIAYLLETGNKPDFDTIGETMVPVQENMAKLSPEDRKAIAAFLKSLPPRPDAVVKKKAEKSE
ncbi:MAG: c-type cytochrome [Methyloceanibacter sp.]|uniref:c-type cytochrome n=1 Tax=Methyloceanibacter sp. TaxID=1965321 RepID=UPI003D6C715F